MCSIPSLFVTFDAWSHRRDVNSGNQGTYMFHSECWHSPDWRRNHPHFRFRVPTLVPFAQISSSGRSVSSEVTSPGRLSSICLQLSRLPSGCGGGGGGCRYHVLTFILPRRFKTISRCEKLRLSVKKAAQGVPSPPAGRIASLSASGSLSRVCHLYSATSHIFGHLDC